MFFMKTKITKHIQLLESNLILYSDTMDNLPDLILKGQLLLKAYALDGFSEELERTVYEWIESIYKYAIEKNLIIDM